VRYEELDRCSRLVDLVVSEATAADVLPRHVVNLAHGRLRRNPLGEDSTIRVEVAGGDDELRQALVEACRAAAYRVEAVADKDIGESPRSPIPSPPGAQRVVTIWEVPLLEPGWAERLERRALRTGPVIALAGFADRAFVARAKAGGAVACLELPLNLDDLLDIIDRTVRSTPLESWPLPPLVEPPQTLRPHFHGPAPRRRNWAPSSSWSDRGPLPRIPR
jgi:hypothetical protein